MTEQPNTALGDGGQAFPGAYMADQKDRGPVAIYAPGLTKREWFAGQALAGILAGGFADTIPHDDVNGGGYAAFFAYQYADAMLSLSRKGGASDV